MDFYSHTHMHKDVYCGKNDHLTYILEGTERWLHEAPCWLWISVGLFGPLEEFLKYSESFEYSTAVGGLTSIRVQWERWESWSNLQEGRCRRRVNDKPALSSSNGCPFWGSGIETTASHERQLLTLWKTAVARWVCLRTGFVFDWIFWGFYSTAAVFTSFPCLPLTL